MRKPDFLDVSPPPERIVRASYIAIESAEYKFRGSGGLLEVELSAQAGATEASEHAGRVAHAHFVQLS